MTRVSCVCKFGSSVRFKTYRRLKCANAEYPLCVGPGAFDMFDAASPLARICELPQRAQDARPDN